MMAMLPQLLMVVAVMRAMYAILCNPGYGLTYPSSSSFARLSLISLSASTSSTHLFLPLSEFLLYSMTTAALRGIAQRTYNLWSLSLESLSFIESPSLSFSAKRSVILRLSSSENKVSEANNGKTQYLTISPRVQSNIVDFKLRFLNLNLYL